MNTWVSAGSINPATCGKDAAARRRRLMSAPVTKPQPVAIVAPPVSCPASVLCKLPKDEHLQAWERWKLRKRMSCTDYARMRAKQMDAPFEKLIGRSRDRKLCAIRDQIIFEMRTDLVPLRSWPKIGRAIGRDHTSALTAYRRAAGRHGDAEAQAKVDLKHHRSWESHQRRKARQLA